jgi:hypothetical protein
MIVGSLVNRYSGVRRIGTRSEVKKTKGNEEDVVWG